MSWEPTCSAASYCNFTRMSQWISIMYKRKSFSIANFVREISFFLSFPHSVTVGCAAAAESWRDVYMFRNPGHAGGCSSPPPHCDGEELRKRLCIDICVLFEQSLLFDFKTCTDREKKRMSGLVTAPGRGTVPA